MSDQQLAIIPDNLPAYLQGGDFAANEDALASLSLGGFPYIKLNGTRFQAIEGDNEHNIQTMELPVVIMRAAPALRKKWYASKYNPNNVDPNKKPDCFSDDGVTPSPASSAPQSKTCAACPHNAFGSGRDQDGKPTEGKACSDNKQLAVYTRAPAQVGAESTIYGLRLPPASLKNFAAYVRALTAKRVPLAAALTVIGFDGNFSYPVLSFRFGGLLNEAQYAQIQKLAQGEEVQAILAATPGAAHPPAAAVPAAAAAAAPVASPTPPPITVADLGLDLVAPVVQPAVQAVQPPPVVVQPAVQPAPVVVQPATPDDMFNDLLVSPPAVAPVVATQSPAATMAESDDALARELGLI